MLGQAGRQNRWGAGRQKESLTVLKKGISQILKLLQPTTITTSGDNKCCVKSSVTQCPPSDTWKNHYDKEEHLYAIATTHPTVQPDQCSTPQEGIPGKMGGRGWEGEEWMVINEF